MDTDFSQLAAQIAPPLIQILVVGLGLALAWSKSGLKNLIANKVSSEKGQAALIYVTDVVYALVLEAQQTSVDELKKAYADGKMTQEELVAGLAEVKKRVLGKAKQLTFGRLLNAFNLDPYQAETLLNAKVEAAVKTIQPTTPPIKDMPATSPLVPQP